MEDLSTMKFVFGVAIGVVGMWAYQSGKLQGLMGGAPEPVQQAWQPAAERIGQVANSPQVQQAVSTVQDSARSARDSMHAAHDSVKPEPEIAKPSAAEVAGRPSDPLPGSDA
jgi:hypothetical protein